MTDTNVTYDLLTYNETLTDLFNETISEIEEISTIDAILNDVSDVFLVFSLTTIPFYLLVMLW